MIRALCRIPDGKLHPFDRAVESVAATRPVIWRIRRAAVLAYVATVIGGENHRLRHRDGSFADLFAINVQRHLSALAKAATSISEFHAHLMLASRQLFRRAEAPFSPTM
jgi:hypothetical protein